MPTTFSSIRIPRREGKLIEAEAIDFIHDRGEKSYKSYNILWLRSNSSILTIPLENSLQEFLIFCNHRHNNIIKRVLSDQWLEIILKIDQLNCLMWRESDHNYLFTRRTNKFRIRVTEKRKREKEKESSEEFQRAIKCNFPVQPTHETSKRSTKAVARKSSGLLKRG